MIKANPSPKGNGFAFNLFGDPNGIRTHDTTVKGWCLNRLTMGPLLSGTLSAPFTAIPSAFCVAAFAYRHGIYLLPTCAVVLSW